MTPTDVTIETGDTSGWGAFFNVPTGLKAHLDGAVASVSAHPRDVFTAKLAATQSFFRSLQAGNVSVIGAPRNALAMPQALALVCLISTFTRLGRLPDIIAPGMRWVRLRGTAAETTPARRMPIMPLNLLHAMSDRDPRHVDTILSILEEDGAIMVLGTGPARGVILMPGFVNDDMVKGLLV